MKLESRDCSSQMRMTQHQHRHKSKELSGCNKDLCKSSTQQKCDDDSTFLKPCVYRTFDDNRAYYAAWVADGEKLNRRKDFINDEKAPKAFFDQFTDVPIVSKAPPVSIHLKLGLFGKIHQELKIVFPKVDEPRKFHATRDLGGASLETKSTGCSSISRF